MKYSRLLQYSALLLTVVCSLTACGKSGQAVAPTDTKPPVEEQMEQYAQSEAVTSAITYEDAIDQYESDQVLYGYITAYDQATVTFRLQIWTDDENTPNGFTLRDTGESQTLPLSPDAAVWIYADSHAMRPYTKADFDSAAFLAYNASYVKDGKKREILWKIALKDETVTAIAEKYIP